MGGKRPDQYRIDPREAQSTDHKTRPIDRKNAKPDADLYGRVMKGTVKKAQPVPPETLEPETALAREEEMERQEHVHETAEEEREKREEG
jgi:cytosine/adenosine deaminase-related metal-dependent hydrolase